MADKRPAEEGTNGSAGEVDAKKPKSVGLISLIFQVFCVYDWLLQLWYITFNFRIFCRMFHLEFCCSLEQLIGTMLGEKLAF